MKPNGSITGKASMRCDMPDVQMNPGPPWPFRGCRVCVPSPIAASGLLVIALPIQAVFAGELLDDPGYQRALDTFGAGPYAHAGGAFVRLAGVAPFHGGIGRKRRVRL